jgi:hypothetical protein
MPNIINLNILKHFVKEFLGSEIERMKKDIKNLQYDNYKMKDEIKIVNARLEALE